MKFNKYIILIENHIKNNFILINQIVANFPAPISPVITNVIFNPYIAELKNIYYKQEV